MCPVFEREHVPTTAGSLLEYGGLAVAAQRSRRGLEDLERNTPADGLITGIARVNGDLFADQTDAGLCAGVGEAVSGAPEAHE